MEIPSKVIDNAIKLFGESVVPGASLLLDGKILPGAAHLIVGSLLRTAIGPVGYGIVIANSYSSSTTGKNLLKQFAKAKKVEGGDERPADVVEAVVAP
ncbi:MAG: DUF6072 family protein [Cyanobium sp.]|jgi:hypothetical protein